MLKSLVITKEERRIKQHEPIKIKRSNLVEEKPRTNDNTMGLLYTRLIIQGGVPHKGKVVIVYKETKRNLLPSSK